MARITWQNVAAPDFRDAILAQDAAGKSFSSAFSGLGDAFKAYDNRQREKLSAQALDRANQINNYADWEAAMARGIQASLGVDPSRLTSDAMTAIMGRGKDIMDMDETEYDFARTQLGHQRTDASNQILDQIGAFSTVAQAQEAWPELQQWAKDNPNMVSEGLRNTLAAGPVANLSAEENMNTAYDASLAATEYTSALFSNPAYFGKSREQLMQIAENETSGAVLKQVQQMISEKGDTRFTSDPVFDAGIRQDPKVSAALDSLELQQHDFDVRKKSVPMYDTISMMMSDGIEGAYVKLINQLEDLPADASGRATLNTIQDFIAENPNVSKDEVAMAVLQGAGLQARTWTAGFFPWRADIVVRKSKLEKDFKALRDAYTNPAVVQSVIEMQRQEKELGRTRQMVDAAIQSASLNATRIGTDMKSADFQAIVKSLGLELYDLTNPGEALKAAQAPNGIDDVRAALTAQYQGSEASQARAAQNVQTAFDQATNTTSSPPPSTPSVTREKLPTDQVGNHVPIDGVSLFNQPAGLQPVSLEAARYNQALQAAADTPFTVSDPNNITTEQTDAAYKFLIEEAGMNPELLNVLSLQDLMQFAATAYAELKNGKDLRSLIGSRARR